MKPDDFRAAVVGLLPRLRRFAYSLTGSPDHADDLAQDVCVRALERAHQWREGSRLDSWMFRIAQNLWIDQTRARKIRGDNLDVGDVAEVFWSDGREIVELRSDLQVVRDCFERLTPEQRVVVALICVNGLSSSEAAETLQKPVGTVMSRLARARRILCAAVRDHEPA